MFKNVEQKKPKQNKKNSSKNEERPNVGNNEIVIDRFVEYNENIKNGVQQFEKKINTGSRRKSIKNKEYNPSSFAKNPKKTNKFNNGLENTFPLSKSNKNEQEASTLKTIFNDLSMFKDLLVTIHLFGGDTIFGKLVEFDETSNCILESNGTKLVVLGRSIVMISEGEVVVI